MALIKSLLENEAFIAGTIVFLVGLGFAALGFWEKNKRRRGKSVSEG